MASLKRILLALFLAVPVYAGDITVQNFGGGLNTQDSPATIDPTQAQDLLNVNFTPGGTAVYKRDGYGQFLSLPISCSTCAVHGGYHFQQVGGNDVQLWGNDVELAASVNDAAFVKVATGTLGATWQCTDSQGFAYCLTSSRDMCVKTDGSSANTTYQSAVPLGTMLTFTPTQLVVAGVSGNESTLYVSGQNAFTNFAIGVLPSSPFTEVIAAPGSRITHIAYYFGKLFWWKDQSFGSMTFTGQNDVQINIISNQIGTLDNSDAFWNSSGFDTGAKFTGTAEANAERSPGGIFFRGQDNHLYVYDGYYLTRLSRNISPTVTAASKRKSNSWTQSSQSDFNGGSYGSSTTYNTSNSGVSLSTGVLQDTSTFQFSQGTSIVNIDTTSVSNAFTLKTILHDSFSSMANWTSTTNAFFPNTFSTSGGATSCSGSCLSFSAQTIPNDWLVQITVNITNQPSFGVANSSNQGYVANLNNGLPTLRATSDMTNPNYPGSTVCQAVAAHTGSHTWTMIRNSASNTLTLYVDGASVCSGTDSTYTSSFSKVQISNSGSDPISNFYLTSSIGNFNSRALTSGLNTYFGTFTAQTSGSGTFTYATRTSASSSSGYSADSVVTSGGTVGSSANRYIIYSATLVPTGLATSLPTVTSISIADIASAGLYYSAVNNATNLTSWGNFVATTGGSGGTHSFAVRSSTSSFTTLSATPTWVAQSVNSAITASTGTFFQMEDSFTITAANQSPTLNSFTFNWYEGSASDKAYITYFNDAIWFSVSASTSSSTNNRIFYWDILNGAWSIYDIAANGFQTENNSLYFGDPIQGRIFKFGGVTTDNSTSINSYWRSKSFLGQDPFVQNEFQQADFVMGQAATTVTYTYTLDSKTSTAYSFITTDSAASLIQRNFMLPVGKIGKYYDFKIGDNDGNASWRLMAHRVHYNPLNWKPVIQ